MTKEKPRRDTRASDRTPETIQSGIVRQNTKSVDEMQRHIMEAESRQERSADRITRFSGSMIFVYLHVIWFGVWILLNTGLIRIPYISEFDPFPFGLLTLVVSLEAIFLSTFVLISQNRQAKISERRNDLDLQIDLLAEQKTAKIIEMLDQVIKQLNSMNNSFYVPPDGEVSALKISPQPKEVIEVLDDSIQEESEEDKEETAQEVVSGNEKSESTFSAR
jgi:uncharacterized membrane protein